MSQHPHLMSPLQIGSFTLKNRIEACPMATSNLTPQAYFTRENIAVFEQRAKGGAAIVGGKASPGAIGAPTMPIFPS